MEIKIKLAIDPFPVPDIVKVTADPARKTLGLPQIGDILLKDLSILELEALCAEFRLKVFEKAGKVAPTVPSLNG